MSMLDTRLGDRVHGWDTETTQVNLGQRGQTPCHTGQVVCATAYCGDDVDFGDGPMLLIDNTGPAAGLIERKFRSYFEDASYKKVFHNYAFDKLMLKREGIAVEGLAADTLILARLHDTSLASWEGRERASKLMKDESMAESFDRSKSLEGKEPSRAVKGVAFAGKKIDLKSFSSASKLHTISIPMEHATKIKQLPKMRMGYDLKSLAFQYGISGSTEPASFRQLFGASGNAAREKFDSPDHFTEFATYAAHDAVYTWKLFHFFQQSLQQTAWNSAVQRRPIDKLLMDDAVADELRNLRPQLFRMSRPKEQGKNRLPRSGGAAGTSGSVQQDTGKTMWDFYSEYVSSRFSECLASMQERGILVDRARLKEIERKATEDLRRMESQYKEILGEIEVEGTVMNPDSGLINPQSHQQLRQLLFGGTKNIFDESEQLEVTRDFSVPKGAKAKDGSKLRSSERFTIESWGLEPAAGRKMFTKKGWPSTGKEALEKLQKDEAQNALMPNPRIREDAMKGAAIPEAARCWSWDIKLVMFFQFKDDATCEAFVKRFLLHELKPHGSGFERRTLWLPKGVTSPSLGSVRSRLEATEVCSLSKHCLPDVISEADRLCRMGSRAHEVAILSDDIASCPVERNRQVFVDGRGVACTSSFGSLVPPVLGRLKLHNWDA
eukprot:s561_g25.t1